ncbi:porin [Klebsiella pneumoniae]|nr:porin [Klebsiella pneumoniae]
MLTHEDRQRLTQIICGQQVNFVDVLTSNHTNPGGLKYDANNIYLATQYTQTYNATRFSGNGESDSISGFANKAQNFEVVAQYQFDFGLRPSVAYLQSKGKDIEGYGDQDLLKYVDVGATYYFNKNMSTYVDYKINLLDENDFTRRAGISTDDVVALGLVYQF